MRFQDILIIALIAAAAVIAVLRVRKGGSSCGPCENCPGSIYCSKKKN